MGRGPMGPSDYISSDSPATSYPFTFSLWFKRLNTTESNIIVTNTEIPSGDWHSLVQRQNGFILAQSTDFGNNSQTASSSAPASSQDVWYHACGVWSAADNRAVYLNGGNKGTNTVNVNTNMAGMDLLQIGQFRDTGADKTALCAEFGYWNAALTDEEVAILGKGYGCQYVRPQDLRVHCPLIRGYQDARSDSTQEIGSVPVVTHPPILGSVPF